MLVPVLFPLLWAPGASRTERLGSTSSGHRTCCTSACTCSSAQGVRACVLRVRGLPACDLLPPSPLLHPAPRLPRATAPTREYNSNSPSHNVNSGQTLHGSLVRASAWFLTPSRLCSVFKRRVLVCVLFCARVFGAELFSACSVPMFPFLPQIYLENEDAYNISQVSALPCLPGCRQRGCVVAAPPPGGHRAGMWEPLRRPCARRLWRRARSPSRLSSARPARSSSSPTSCTRRCVCRARRLRTVAGTPPPLSQGAYCMVVVVVVAAAAIEVFVVMVFRV